jgi:CheY-like chemotaxis protein
MILFIDDEKRRMVSYVEELEFSLEQEVHFETEVDSAIDFFHAQVPLIDLVILDVMMPAGDSFRESDTEYGLKTGLYLYKKLRVQRIDLPIVIFTNASDPHLAKEIDIDKKGVFLQKEDFLPAEFAEEIKKFLA